MLMGELSMAALVQSTEGYDLLFNSSDRCLSFCQEEQTMLQLKSRGVRLAPLPWNLTLQRISGRASPDESRTAYLERLSLARDQGAPGPANVTKCHARGDWGKAPTPLAGIYR